MHQYTDKEAPTSKLARATQNSFFMKEQKLVTPEHYQNMIDNADQFSCAERVCAFIDSHKNQPRFNEEAPRIEHRLRDKITASVKLPKKA